MLPGAGENRRRQDTRACYILTAMNRLLSPGILSGMGRTLRRFGRWQGRVAQFTLHSHFLRAASPLLKTNPSVQSMDNPHDASKLVIRAGRVVCPTSGVDSAATVAITDGRITSVDASLDPWSDSVVEETTHVLNCPQGIVVPGLTDLHAHPAGSQSVFGVEPDQVMLSRGVTTVQSQGDAGALGIDQYVQDTINSSLTRVMLAINLSRIGESTQSGCLENPADADVEQCVSAIERHRDVVSAVSVNASHHACGRSDPREILSRGIQVAERCGLPILFGMRRPEDWPIDEQLQLLRPGDVVTYCFRRTPHCIVAHGRVLGCVNAARKRGILFDVGHGMASFSFEVAIAAIADGFEPDTISTDLQNRHMGGLPQHDLPLVMSKLRAAGMPEPAVLAAATCRPAEVLRMESLSGTLMPGAFADLVILDVVSDQVFVDVEGYEVTGPLWTPQHTIRAGQLIRSQASG
jgi:dihydroorotase